MSDKKPEQGDSGRDALENEFRAMFAERSETVRTVTAPYAAVRQRIVAARRRRRMRIGGAGLAFAAAVAGVGVWAAAPGANHGAVGPASHGQAAGTHGPATGTPAKVLYAGGRSEIPAGPLRDAAVNWLRANYSGDLSGLTVVTTFDQTVQNAASAKASAGDSGVVVVDSRSGAVLALGGAWDRPLPVGDTIKPIVLGAAFTTGDYTPDSTVPLDAAKHPLYWPTGANAPLTYLAGGKTAYWPPESPTTDISDKDVTLRQAAELGANEPFVQLELAPDVSPAMVRNVAVQMGMPTNTPDLLAVPSLALGTPQTTPLTMAGVYATLADGGVHHGPRMVGELLANDGQAVWTSPATTDPGTAITPSAAQQVTDVLHSALTDGTTGTAVEPRTSAEAETWAMAGAADTGRAAWFDGADGQYVISVGVSTTDGHGNLLPLPGASHGGADVGSRIAGPIWAGMVQTLRNRG